MRNFVFWAAALVICFGSIVHQADGGPKTRAAMKKCMKGGLCKKVATGKGNANDKAVLIAAFKAMATEKPPKGDADSWKTRTDALIEAAQLAVDGDVRAGLALKNAANCKDCHTAHKGS